MCALFFLEDLELTQNDVNNVRRFMGAIEKNYKLPKGVPDVEYITNAQLLGTVGGAAVGGIVGGSAFGVPGAIGGSLLGGAGGFLIGSSFH
jgi:hypothetical protein